MSSPDFLKAALTLLERGWLAHPLGLDANRLPKRPLTMEWTSLERNEQTIRSLNWAGAAGLGLVLGEKSSGLCVLDIDHQELFDATLLAIGGPYVQRAVRTVRKRGHLYFQATDNPGQSSVRDVTWRGELVKVELKSNGTQVAAPPTPGYELLALPIGEDQPQPKLEFDVQSAFTWWFDCIEATVPGQLVVAQEQVIGAGYPKPFMDHVPKGERNNATYIESLRLAQAGVSLDQALDFMEARVSRSYEQGELDLREIENTVRSAYTKQVFKFPHEQGEDELHLLD